jgi:hypothetical protein
LSIRVTEVKEKSEETLADILEPITMISSTDEIVTSLIDREG